MINSKQTGRLMVAMIVAVMFLWGIHSGPVQAQPVSQQDVFGKKTYDML